MLVLLLIPTLVLALWIQWRRNKSSERDRAAKEKELLQIIHEKAVQQDVCAELQSKLVKLEQQAEQDRSRIAAYDSMALEKDERINELRETNKQKETQKLELAQKLRRSQQATAGLVTSSGRKAPQASGVKDGLQLAPSPLQGTPGMHTPVSSSLQLSESWSLEMVRHELRQTQQERNTAEKQATDLQAQLTAVVEECSALKQAAERHAEAERAAAASLAAAESRAEEAQQRAVQLGSQLRQSERMNAATLQDMQGKSAEAAAVLRRQKEEAAQLQEQSVARLQQLQEQSAAQRQQLETQISQLAVKLQQQQEESAAALLRQEVQAAASLEEQERAAAARLLAHEEAMAAKVQQLEAAAAAKLQQREDAAAAEQQQLKESFAVEKLRLEEEAEAKLQQQREQLDGRLQQLQEESAAALLQFEARSSEQQADSAAQMQQLEAKLSQQEADSAVVQQQLRDQLSQQEAAAAAKLQQQADEAAAHQQQLKDQLSQQEAAAAAKLQEEEEASAAAMDELQTQLEATQTQLEASQTQLEATQTQLEATQTELEATQTQLEASQTQLEASQQELSKVQADHDQVQTDRDQLRESLVVLQLELQRSKDSHIQDTTTLSNELEASEMHIDHFRSELECIENSLPEMYQRLMCYKARIHNVQHRGVAQVALDVETLEECVDELQVRSFVLMQQNQELVKERDLLVAERQGLHMVRDKHKDRLAQVEESYNQSATEAQQLRGDLARAEAELSKAQAELSKVMAEQPLLRQVLEAAQARGEELKGQLSAAQAELAVAHAGAEVLHGKVKQLTAQLAEQQGSAAAAEQAQAGLQAQVVASQQEVERLTACEAELKKEVSDLSTEMVRVRALAQEMLDDNEVLAAENEAQAEELERYCSVLFELRGVVAQPGTEAPDADDDNASPKVPQVVLPVGLRLGGSSSLAGGTPGVDAAGAAAHADVALGSGPGVLSGLAAAQARVRARSDAGLGRTQPPTSESSRRSVRLSRSPRHTVDESQLQALRVQVPKLKAEAAMSRAELDVLHAQVAALRDELQSASQKLSTAQAAALAAASDKSLAAHTVAALEGRCQQLHEEVSSLTQELQDAQSGLLTTQQQATHLQATIAQRQATISQLQDAVTTLEEQKEQAEAAAAAARAELAEKAELLSQMTAASMESHIKNESLVKEHHSLMANGRQALDRIAALDKEVNETYEELQNKELELLSSQGRVEELQAATDSLKQQLNTAEAAAAGLASQTQQLKEELAGKQHEVDQLHKVNQSLIHRAGDKTIGNCQVEQLLQEAHADLEATRALYEQALTDAANHKKQLHLALAQVPLLQQQLSNHTRASPGGARPGRATYTDGLQESYNDVSVVITQVSKLSMDMKAVSQKHQALSRRVSSCSSRPPRTASTESCVVEMASPPLSGGGHAEDRNGNGKENGLAEEGDAYDQGSQGGMPGSNGHGVRDGHDQELEEQYLELFGHYITAQGTLTEIAEREQPRLLAKLASHARSEEVLSS